MLRKLRSFPNASRSIVSVARNVERQGVGWSFASGEALRELLAGVALSRAGRSRKNTRSISRCL
jgi:hypothetical protein